MLLLSLALCHLLDWAEFDLACDLRTICCSGSHEQSLVHASLGDLDFLLERGNASVSHSCRYDVRRRTFFLFLFFFKHSFFTKSFTTRVCVRRSTRVFLVVRRGGQLSRQLTIHCAFLPLSATLFSVVSGNSVPTSLSLSSTILFRIVSAYVNGFFVFVGNKCSIATGPSAAVCHVYKDALAASSFRLPCVLLCLVAVSARRPAVDVILASLHDIAASIGHLG